MYLCRTQVCIDEVYENIPIHWQVQMPIGRADSPQCLCVEQDMTACFNSPAFHLKPSPLNALIFWRKFTKPVQSLVVAALVFVPVVSFAQSDHPLTRADVRAELVQLRQAGYKPASDNTQYPQNMETALALINVKNGLP